MPGQGWSLRWRWHGHLVGWRDSGLRRPLGIALTVGVLSWGFGNLAWYSFEQGTRLPEMALRDSRDGRLRWRTTPANHW